MAVAQQSRAKKERRKEGGLLKVSQYVSLHSHGPSMTRSMRRSETILECGLEQGKSRIWIWRTGRKLVL